jgi:hypothetical protein
MSSSLSPRTDQFFPQRSAPSRGLGLPARASSVLALADCQTVEDVRRLSSSYFNGRRNCGKQTLNELAQLAGWPRRTPVDAIATALLLAIRDPEEARETALDVLSAIRRSGFVLAASKRVERARA